MKTTENLKIYSQKRRLFINSYFITFDVVKHITVKERQTYRTINNRNFQLTRNGAFQLKKFPAYFKAGDYRILYRLSTFSTNQFYFEIVLN